MKIAFIGGGNMAEALLKGLLGAGHPAAEIRVGDPTDERRRMLAERYGVSTTGDNREAAAGADVVLLAVKPATIPEVCRELAGLAPDRLFVSVAAGVPTSKILRELGPGTRLVRVMPNTPALVGAGMAVLSPAGSATEEDLAAVRRIFGAVGRAVVLPETLMDAVTGLSGSGPAYVFVVIEALADGGVKAGLPRAEALTLAAQTVLGAAKLVIETGLHPGELKDRVASPGGTTIEGLHRLEEAGLRSALISAVTAAARRSAELGKES